MSERTSDAIRREIERKRQEMDRTVDQLERKLTPAQMLDHALWLLRGSDTGSERTRAFADGVVGFAKSHPIPVALMSAGAAWLAAESRRREPDVGPGTYAPAEGRVGPYLGDALEPGPLRGDDAADASERPSLVARARDTAGELKDRVAEGVSGATDAVRGGVHAVGDRVDGLRNEAAFRVDALRADTEARVAAASDRLHATADAARARGADVGRRARAQYDTTLEDNPLALGAAAFGLGLAAGLSAPATRLENDLLGAKSDALKGEARAMASDATRAARTAGSEAIGVIRREALPDNVIDEVKGRVQRIASDALDAAKETAGAEGVSKEQILDRAKRVALDAVHTAQDAAKREGLTPDALKERAVVAKEAIGEAKGDKP